MKDFIIYAQPMRGKMWPTEKCDIEQLRKSPGTSGLVELEFIRSGEVAFVYESDVRRIFRFRGEYLMPKLTAATAGPIWTTLEFEMWQQKNNPVVMTFDARRKASRVAVALLSLAKFGDPFAIVPVTLAPSDFCRLKDLILQKNQGSVTQLALRGVRSSAGNLRKLDMAGQNLERFLNFDELLKTASSVHSMGFAVPKERRLSFRVVEWGGGQMYTPVNPLDHEIQELIELLWEAIFGRVQA